MLHSEACGSRAPFMPVNCGAIPEPLAEAELFGHTRGAFTGAVHARPGLIKSATNGTLFLDEVDSLSPPIQSKLLRFLETGDFRPVGADRIEHAHVWVMAATNIDLWDAVRRGRFREDLLYRLDVVHLDMPALRLRGSDIELLARHFLAEVGGSEHHFTPRAIRSLYAHDWPGNVRELKLRVERAVLFAQGPDIDTEDLELGDALDSYGHAPRQHQNDVADLWYLIERDGLSLAEAITHCERAFIAAALQAENGNRTRAAQRLGIHVRTIFKKLRR